MTTKESEKLLLSAQSSDLWVLLTSSWIPCHWILTHVQTSTNKRYLATTKLRGGRETKVNISEDFNFSYPCSKQGRPNSWDLKLPWKTIIFCERFETRQIYINGTLGSAKSVAKLDLKWASIRQDEPLPLPLASPITSPLSGNFFISQTFFCLKDPRWPQGYRSKGGQYCIGAF